MMDPAHLRVVSLVPSVTETLLAWGLPPVACTRFCEAPGIPTVGGTKNPDVAAVVSLGPDLVVVCDEENRQEDATAITAAGIAVHSCSPRSVADVEPAMAALAEAVGAAPVPRRTGSPSPGVGPARPRAQPRRAFVPVWRRPWMTLAGDTYGSSVLEAVGLRNVFAERADRYPEVTLEEAADARPDLVVAPSEPYPFGARHVAELERVAPVMLVDGRDLFWWGVRTPDALARLSVALAV